MESVGFLARALNINPIFITLAVIWTLIWKGLALWRSATLRQKGWFVAFLIVNTLGILEIVYLYFISKKYEVQVVDER